MAEYGSTSGHVQEKEVALELVPSRPVATVTTGIMLRFWPDISSGGGVSIAHGAYLVTVQTNSHVLPGG